MVRVRRLRGWQYRAIAVTLCLLISVATSAAQNSLPATGNVGIGTMSPAAPLQVYGNGTNTPAIFSSVSHTRIVVTTPDTTKNPKVQLDRGGSNPWEIGVDNGYGTGGLYVYGGNAYRFGITPSGNVGIGTTSPAAMLHVSGNVQVDGNIAAKYQDVAEWVKTSGSLPNATVVVIDPRDLDRVVVSDRAYDTRVAGVVSPQPGLLLGEGGPDKAKVAHSGRVKLKVDAGYGAVGAGDLLVTSPTPGHAMRSEPVLVGGVAMHRPGTLIGKALEPLAEGQGEILVLLMLQ
jgi:hypothetical protein